MVLKTSNSRREWTKRELRQRLAEQETLFAIIQLVSSKLQISAVIQIVAEQMAHLVGAASCTIFDWDPKHETLTAKVEYIRPEQTDPNHPIQEIGTFCFVVDYPARLAAIRDHKPFVVYVKDREAYPQECDLLQAWRRQGVAGIPLIVQGRVIGLAEVYLSMGAKPFDDHDLRLLQTLANQVAVAIDNARLFAAVQASEATMRDLSLRLLKAQEQERRHIAQELHDELGQLLTAIKIDVDLARRKLPATATSLPQRLDEASALLDEVLTKVRALTVELRPTLLDDLGLIPTLRWYLGRFAQRTGLQAHLEAPELPARLRPEIEMTIYRSVQEALTNVARHAQATWVQVRLAYSANRVTVSVVDDGRGFDERTWSEHRPEQQTLGLTGIRERVTLLGGRVDIVSQPGQGTRIELRLPAHFDGETG